MRHLHAAASLCGISDTNIINIFRFSRDRLLHRIAKNASMPAAAQSSPQAQDHFVSPKNAAQKHIFHAADRKMSPSVEKIHNAPSCGEAFFVLFN